MTVTKILGAQAGIQYQGVVDKSEADPRDSLVNALFTGEFKNGPYNKPFKVTAANIRKALGFDPENLQYQAIEDCLKQGVPFVWAMRIKQNSELEPGPGPAPEPEPEPCNCESSWVLIPELTPSVKIGRYDEFIVSIKNHVQNTGMSYSADTAVIDLLRNTLNYSDFENRLELIRCNSEGTLLRNKTNDCLTLSMWSVIKDENGNKESIGYLSEKDLCAYDASEVIPEDTPPPTTEINLPIRVAPFGPGGITELVNFYPINKLSNNSEYTLAIELDTTNLEPGDRVLLSSDDYLNDSSSMFYEFAPRNVTITADDLESGVVYVKFFTTKYVSNYSAVAFAESGFLSIQIIKQDNSAQTEIGAYRFTQTLPLYLRADTAWGNQAEISHGLVGNNPYITPIYTVRASLENGPTSFRLDDGSDYDLSSNGAWEGAKRWDTWAHQNKVYFEYQMIALSQSDGELPLFGTPARLPFVGISERDIGTGMSYDDNVSNNQWPYGIYVAKDGYIYHGNSSPQAFAGRDIVNSDVIGVLVDREASTATFSLNGQSLYVGNLDRRNLYIQDQGQPDATTATPSIFTTGGMTEVGLSLYSPTWLYGQSDYQEFK